MANIEHSAITDPNIHEPKGAADADAGTVYVADGAGSGDWSPIRDIYQGFFTDVSTAEVKYVPIAHSGTVVLVSTVLAAAINTDNATVTAKNAAGASMGTITVAYTSSAAGDVDTLVPASNNTVGANSFVTVETDGGSTGTAPTSFLIVVERSTV